MTTPSLERWDPARFYWASLEAAGPRRPGPLPPGLLPDLEELVPEPLGELFAVAAPLGGRIIVCAARIADLSAMPREVQRLAPSFMPPELNAQIDPAVFNLLVGPFEPHAQRSRRSRACSLKLLAAGVALMLVAIGLHRRAANAEEAAHGTRRAMASLRLPDGRPATAASLEAENARLRALHQALARQGSPPDARPVLSSVLGSVLADWSAEAEVLSITATGDDALITAHTPGDPASLLSATRVPQGWRLMEPRVSGVGSSARAVLTLRREAKP